MRRMRRMRRSRRERLERERATCETAITIQTSIQHKCFPIIWYISHSCSQEGTAPAPVLTPTQHTHSTVQRYKFFFTLSFSLQYCKVLFLLLLFERRERERNKQQKTAIKQACFAHTVARIRFAYMKQQTNKQKKNLRTPDPFAPANRN